ncbi:Helix-turn-helix domain [Myroides odoratus]|uniref:Helix-turn-helix domain n=2 Tax=Myroides odoratus TaxID=256 RepID=A0A378RL38_MYROD|nr:Helix-turn-helix domain [Myroides odoratus]
MISAMTCGIIFLVIFHKSLSIRENKIRQTLGGYYLLMIVLWLTVNIALDYGHHKLYFIPFLFLLIQLTHVVFYHFFCHLVPTKDKFNTLHYKIAGIIFIMTGALVYILHRTTGFNTLDLNYFFFEYLYVYATLNMLCYTGLCLFRVYKAHLEQSHSKQSPLSLNWIHYLLLLKVLFLILFIFNNHRVFSVYLILVFIIAIQHIILTYNILQRNIEKKPKLENKTNVMLPSGQIVSVDHQGIIENVTLVESTAKTNLETSSLLTEQDFLAYFTKEKPYLNKQYKLDDLVTHFGLNRTYVSKFINITFNSNLSQFINSYRLKEVEELKKAHPTHEIEEIILQAGFSNYRHYLRAKERFEQDKKRIKP